MNTIRIDPEIQKRPRLSNDVEKINVRLNTLLGRSAGRVSADWKLVQPDQDSEVLRLQLSEPTASVVGQFSAEELSRPDHMVRRLNWLWGDLLQIRSDRQLEELLTSTNGQR